MTEIVKALNVAQGTFYFYFKSKEDVLSAVIQRAATEMLERFCQRMDEPSKTPASV